MRIPATCEFFGLDVTVNAFFGLDVTVNAFFFQRATFFLFHTSDAPIVPFEEKN